MNIQQLFSTKISGINNNDGLNVSKIMTSKNALTEFSNNNRLETLIDLDGILKKYNGTYKPNIVNNLRLPASNINETINIVINYINCAISFFNINLTNHMEQFNKISYGFQQQIEKLKKIKGTNLLSNLNVISYNIENGETHIIIQNAFEEIKSKQNNTIPELESQPLIEDPISTKEPSILNIVIQQPEIETKTCLQEKSSLTIDNIDELLKTYDVCLNNILPLLKGSSPVSQLEKVIKYLNVFFGKMNTLNFTGFDEEYESIKDFINTQVYFYGEFVGGDESYGFSIAAQNLEEQSKYVLNYNLIKIKNRLILGNNVKKIEISFDDFNSIVYLNSINTNGKLTNEINNILLKYFCNHN